MELLEEEGEQWKKLSRSQKRKISCCLFQIHTQIAVTVFAFNKLESTQKSNSTQNKMCRF